MKVETDQVITLINEKNYDQVLKKMKDEIN